MDCWLLFRTLPATTGYITTWPVQTWPPLAWLDLTLRKKKTTFCVACWTAGLGGCLVNFDWCGGWCDIGLDGVGREFSIFASRTAPCQNFISTSSLMPGLQKKSNKKKKTKSHWTLRNWYLVFYSTHLFLTNFLFQFQINFCDYLHIICFAHPSILCTNTFATNTLGISPFEFCPWICIHPRIFYTMILYCDTFLQSQSSTLPLQLMPPCSLHF